MWSRLTRGCIPTTVIGDKIAVTCRIGATLAAGPQISQKSGPLKSEVELEAECLRLLAMDPSTRDITHVRIIRLNPEGSGPNWTFGELEPPPTRNGYGVAQTLIASLYGKWALAD